MDDDIDVTMNYKQQTNLNSTSTDSECCQIQCLLSLLHDEGNGNVELNLSNFQNVSFIRIDEAEDRNFRNFLGLSENIT